MMFRQASARVTELSHYGDEGFVGNQPIAQTFTWSSLAMASRPSRRVASLSLTPQPKLSIGVKNGKPKPL